MITENEIIEGNKLIRSFIGLAYRCRWVNYYQIGNDIYSESELKFHLKWDYLMPVVGKINDVIKPHIKADSCLAHLCLSLAKGDIEATWLAVVDFIKWYNQQ